MNCPCQSGETYDSCCGRFISHQAVAENAQQLMRSRYSAYALNKLDYLIQSWHPDFRPDELQQDESIKWLGLDIINYLSGNDEAMVEFEALMLVNGKIQGMHEKSRFVLENSRWLYTSGDAMEPNCKTQKPGRNAACPCGSGFKFKRCCGQ